MGTHIVRNLSGDPEIANWLTSVKAELLTNILPFWAQYTPDPANGGFYGALANDRRIDNSVPRSAVLCARILWTFSTAYRHTGDPTHLATAVRAYEYLTGSFWDQAHGGVYWTVDKSGSPLSARKQTYAQAFAIYGLTEFYRATRESAALTTALALFELLEKHAYDAVCSGYFEGRSPTWDALSDMRLSEKEPNCSKSMNTMLHVMEAYTNLLRVWNDSTLRIRMREILTLHFERMIDPRTHRFRLFFDDMWRPQPDHISYGHDIEGSWLLVEAAEVLGDASLVARARGNSVLMAASVLDHGLTADGALLAARHLDGRIDTERHWWPQAEGVVGFLNAYQLSGEDRFLQASLRCWGVIQTQFVDAVYGDWYKVLDAHGVPLAGQWKVGPWECPYHHARMCLEVMARLSPRLRP